MTNGPYNYYLPNKPDSTLCEVEGKRVWFIGDDQYTPLAMCSGRFVRLVEQPQPEDAQGEKEGKSNESI